MANLVTRTFYECGTCGKLHNIEYGADICCKQWVCEICGKETTKGRNLCDICSRAERDKKATEYTVKEYKEKFPGYAVVHDGEFYWDVEDIYEYFEKEELPDYVYGTKKGRVEVDIEQAIEWAYEDSYEDCELDNTEELIKYVENWNKDNGKDCYWEDFNIIVMLDKQEESE